MDLKDSKVDSIVLCAVDRALDNMIVTTLGVQSQSPSDTKHKIYLEDAYLCEDIIRVYTMRETKTSTKKHQWHCPSTTLSLCEHRL